MADWYCVPLLVLRQKVISESSGSGGGDGGT